MFSNPVCFILVYIYISRGFISFSAPLSQNITQTQTEIIDIDNLIGWNILEKIDLVYLIYT